MESVYDLTVVGLGPAGISAAIYGVRGNLKTLAIGKKSGSLYDAEVISNFYGQGDISGKNLFNKGILNAKKSGVEVKVGEVFDILFDGEIFSLKTDKGEIKSKAVVLATGAKRNKPDIKNLETYEGKGVSYCAVCDGFLYRRKNVAVLGEGKYAESEAKYLSGLNSNVTILTNGREVSGFKGFNVITKKINKLFGDDLEKVIFDDGEELEISALFICEGSATSLDFARKIGLPLKDGKVIVDDNMETAQKGLFCAGDMTGGLMQVSKAVSDGAKAGLSAIKYVKG